ncbi:MAG: hypothetical protein CK551_02620 [Planctomycetaceae bacterium]|nr:MAG: hypothetical protein CK551_02620 [Planctomycetaceae bacterium]
MPPRLISVMIVMLFIVVNTSLFYTEILPRIRSGLPPSFNVDLADEAGNLRPVVNWKVLVRGEEFLKLRTGVTLVDNQEDEFWLWAEYSQPTNAGLKPARDFLGLKLMRNEFRVHRDGDMLGLQAKVQIESLRGVDFPLTLEISGEVSNGLLRPEVKVDSRLGERTFKLESMDVPVSGAVFQPFLPVHRILGLYPGRTWKQPFFDPLSLAFSSGVAQGGLDQGTGSVIAKVRNDIVDVMWGGKKIPCIIIDYTGSDLESTVWVGVQNGMVIRQKNRLSESMEWDLIRLN